MSDETKVDETQIAEWQNAAETLLTGAWGGHVRLTAPEPLRKPGYRNQIVRFGIADAPAGSPATVIVKIAQGTPEEPYDPANDVPESPAWRFYNEWAGNRFLNGVAGPPLNARLYGGDKATGLFVLEDLGKPSSLADAMQQTDPDRLRDALFRYAKGLGQLHAATRGHENEFLELRRERAGSKASVPEPVGVEWLRDSVTAFRGHAGALGVILPAEWDAEAAIVVGLLDNPGAFSAFSPGDTCPDNHRLMEDGSLRFFDFEFAGFGHALRDAAYLCVPFPTCWCVNRLPGDLSQELVQAYRTELSASCPEAGDDRTFGLGLAAACAYWTVTTVGWSAKEALEKDSQWGIATERQRIPFRLDNFARIADQTKNFPAMAHVARALAEKFRALWPDTEEMSLYATFRDKKTP